MQTWYSESSSIRSLGSTLVGPGSLAGLAAARKENLGQFFTPDVLARWMWKAVEPAIDRAIAKAAVEGARVSLVDNSVGSGRLLQFANPEKHTLAGIDVHKDSIEVLSSEALDAGFRAQFVCAGMETVRLSGFGVALINPPFSIHLDSPHTEAFECNTFGKFGPASSCASHVYAVAQALKAASVVVAVLPLSFAMTLPGNKLFSERLAFLGKLPANTFREEGADVATAVAIWDHFPANEPVQMVQVKDFNEVPTLNLTVRSEVSGIPRIEVAGEDATDIAAINTPVTGNKAVRVVHHGRRLILKFSCGLIEAKVLNHVFRERLEHAGRLDGFRYPRHLRYVGEGALDLHLYLMQQDPLAAFEEFCAAIRQAGGEPLVDRGIYGYLKRRARWMQRQRVAFRHVVRASGDELAATGTDTCTAVAKQTFSLAPRVWGSKSIKAGERVQARRIGDNFEITAAGKDWSFSADDFLKKFSVDGGEQQGAWVVKSEGRGHAFPSLVQAWKSRAVALGLDKHLSWGYQLDDLLELALSPLGSIVAWEMGLGKARLAIALALLHGCERNLLVVEAHLLDEMQEELEKLGIPADQWQIIRTTDAARTLRRINVISYNRLRMPVAKGARKTYACMLRHRIGVLIADEGHCVKNGTSEQTQALYAVGARRRYVLTGTPIPNYPRDVLPIVSFVYGASTAWQPYGAGAQDLFMAPYLLQSMLHARRAVDEFKGNFVTLEWCVNEFAETLAEGAKREIPKISNLGEYRRFLAPLMKRRLAHEPEVAKYVRIPVPVISKRIVQWGETHMAHYLRVADSFAQWYRAHAKDESKRSNLVALLARVGAVVRANNIPQESIDGFGCLTDPTNKQMAAAERAIEWASEGRQCLIYAHSPSNVEIIADLIEKAGVSVVRLSGAYSQAARTRSLNLFRRGKVMVAVCTVGVCQTGLNIPQASRVLFVDRAWTAKTEAQAMARVLRPQQKSDVGIEYLHLPGSIDEYMDQMCSFKADAAASGLDWAAPETEGVEYLHIDTILGRFVEGLAAMHGKTAHEMRSILKAA